MSKAVKLDENLSIQLPAELLKAGVEAHTCQQEGLLGQSDEEVGKAAAAENRMLFTLDLDFADMRRHRPGRHPGIVLFRPRSMGPGAVSSFVLEFVRTTSLDDLAGCIAIVEPGRVRIRRPDTFGE